MRGWLAEAPLRPVRVLLVGAGRWGSVHARTVREAGGVLAGVVDVDEGAARRLASRHGCSAYTSLEDALAEGGFDAAIVAVPPGALARVAERLIRAGVHVLVEKPVATSSSEARRLAALAERRGVVALAGYLLRFHPATLLAARLVAAISPRLIRASRILPRPPAARRWPLDLDLAVHDVDLVRLLGGPWWRLASRVESGSEGERSLVLVYEWGGRLAEVTVSEAAGGKRRVLELHGPRGSLVLDYDAGAALLCGAGGCEGLAYSGEPPLTVEHRVFYSMVARALGLSRARHPLEPLAATLRDAAAVLEMLGR